MKSYILSIAAVVLLAGCNAEKQPEPTPVVEKKQFIEVANPYDEDKVVVAKKVYKKKVYKKKAKIKGKYYRMTSKKVEAFVYKGRLSSATRLDDKKIRDSFYIKGNLVKISNIYTTKLGDRYGRIAGKRYIVSMDDLTTYSKK
jgi:hypothetical protein